MNDCMEYKDIM